MNDAVNDFLFYVGLFYIFILYKIYSFGFRKRIDLFLYILYIVYMYVKYFFTSNIFC